MKFVKEMNAMKLMMIYMSLLEIGSTLINIRLLSQDTLLFNRPSRDILPRFSRPPIVCSTDEK